MLTYKRRLTTYHLTHTVSRRIPKTGRSLVKVGQSVLPHQIVSVGEASAGFRSLDLAKLLKVKPTEIKKFLIKNEGSFIYEGELLAKKEEYLGVREVEIHSPMDGVLAQVNQQTGVINLEYMPKSLKVPAGVAGQVVGISESAVKIEAQVSRVQGVAGSGSLKEGVIQVIGSWELPLRVDQIVSSLAGKIIVGGSQVTKEVLYKCLALRVAGVVSGGINFADFQDLVGPRGPTEDVGVGLLVLGGFGNFPISREDTAIFDEFNQQPALLYGAKARLLFPEFKADKRHPKPPSIDELAGFGILKTEQKVKLLNKDYLGLSGIIKKLELGPRELPSGLKTQTVVVELTDGREVEVGARNVEISL